MGEKEKQLREEVDKLLAQAAQAAAAADAPYGKGRRGDELPAELVRRESRLQKIAAAQAALAQEARERATVEKAAAEARWEERRRPEEAPGKKFGGRPPQVPDPEHAQPEPKAQRHFTDPDSRIMKDGATKSFVRAYHAQAAVDSQAQIIVAAALTPEANDKKQWVPMREQVAENRGRRPEQATADAGYFSEAAVTGPKVAGIELPVPPDRQKHGVPSETSPVIPSVEPVAAVKQKGQPSGDRGGATAAGQKRGGGDARQATVAHRAGGLQNAQGGRGAGIWTNQRTAGIARLPDARPGKGGGGMANNLPHAQPA